MKHVKSNNYRRLHLQSLDLFTFVYRLNDSLHAYYISTGITRNVLVIPLQVRHAPCQVWKKIYFIVRTARNTVLIMSAKRVLSRKSCISGLSPKKISFQSSQKLA